MNVLARIRSHWKLHRAGAAAARGDFPVAFDLYREIVDDFGESEQAMSIWNRMGMLAYARKDFATSIHCYERALAIDPEEPGLYMNLANALHELGDGAGAKSAYERALAVTRRADLLYNYAVFLGEEDPRRAIALLREVLHPPDEPERSEEVAGLALTLLARLGQRHSLVPEASLVFSELEERPRADLPPWEVLNQQANMLSHAGRHEEALALFDRILATWPQETDVRYNLGMALIRAGRPRDAQAEFLRVKHPFAHYGMARTHELENRTADAVDEYRKFVEGMTQEHLASFRLHGWDPGAEEIKHATEFIARHP